MSYNKQMSCNRQVCCDEATFNRIIGETDCLLSLQAIETNKLNQIPNGSIEYIPNIAGCLLDNGGLNLTADDAVYFEQTVSQFGQLISGIAAIFPSKVKNLANLVFQIGEEFLLITYFGYQATARIGIFPDNDYCALPPVAEGIYTISLPFLLFGSEAGGITLNPTLLSPLPAGIAAYLQPTDYKARFTFDGIRYFTVHFDAAEKSFKYTSLLAIEIPLTKVLIGKFL